MLTGSRDNAIGAAFNKAPKDSPFHKVFLNNMDKKVNISFSSDIDKQIALTISKTETAFYYTHSTMLDRHEYQNCDVCKTSKIRCAIKPIINQNNLTLGRECLVS